MDFEDFEKSRSAIAQRNKEICKLVNMVYSTELLSARVRLWKIIALQIVDNLDSILENLEQENFQEGLNIA
jgi:hypothetical protein